MQEKQSAIVARDLLTTRTIPEMVLSEAGSPLTAPLLTPNLSPAERVAQRFSVVGNAIVTGGAGYLGLAAIRSLLEHGASGISIFDLDISISSSRVAIEAMISDFPQCTIITHEVDVTDDKAVELAVGKTIDALGAVNMLLCFAGVVANTDALDVTPAEWRRVIDINLTGSWLCAQSVAKRMVSQGTGGNIIFISSIAGHSVLFPQPQVSYNVSKAGILHLTRCLAAEWTRYGIRVNSISPGYMNTILNAGDTIAPARQIWAARNPMGRMGEPEELTGVVVLLCSQFAGRYITGEDITVDGGGKVF